MKHLFAVANAMLIALILFPATPTMAACAESLPTIGVIRSIKTFPDQPSAWPHITLDHADVFNASAFATDSTNIDAYNALAQAYIQNSYQTPSNYAYQFSSYENPVTTRNSLEIMISPDALSRVSYNVGDIIIQGPPIGGECGLLGFIGFFGQNGVVRYAVANDAKYYPYIYGSETLSIAPANDYSCATNGIGTNCTRSIRYSLGGTSNILQPGDSKILSGNHFTNVSLLQSTHTTVGQNGWIEDFFPDSMLHVLTFATGTQPPSATLTASPTSGTAPLSVIFSGWGNDSYALIFGDGQKQEFWGGCAGNPSGPCGFRQINHTYNSPGTYTASLTSDPCPGQPCMAPVQMLGSVTITVTGQNNTSAPSIVGIDGPTQLQIGQQGTWSVHVSDSSNYLSYSVHWGDESSMPLAYGSSASASVVNSGTFTHSYTAPGSYTPTFTVTNSSGQSATANVSVSVGSSATYPPNPPPLPTPFACPILQRSLSRGSRGSDVVTLQEYFVSIGLLASDNATGYFGTFTEGAVQGWQSSHGIISYGAPTTTGFGAVGPRTRAALSRCNQ